MNVEWPRAFPDPNDTGPAGRMACSAFAIVAALRDGGLEAPDALAALALAQAIVLEQTAPDDAWVERLANGLGPAVLRSTRSLALHKATLEREGGAPVQ